MIGVAARRAVIAYSELVVRRPDPDPRSVRLAYMFVEICTASHEAGRACRVWWSSTSTATRDRDAAWIGNWRRCTEGGSRKRAG